MEKIKVWQLFVATFILTTLIIVPIKATISYVDDLKEQANSKRAEEHRQVQQERKQREIERDKEYFSIENCFDYKNTQECACIRTERTGKNCFSCSSTSYNKARKFCDDNGLNMDIIVPGVVVQGVVR